MSEFSDNFVKYLSTLSEQQPGAMAVLRRSLAFDPGAYPAAYPYVERFVSADHSANHPQRLAIYLVSGLFALHPLHETSSLASSLAQMMKRSGKDQGSSTEKRFVALLGAEAEDWPTHLRQIVSLLSAHGLGLNFATLLNDLGYLLNTHLDPMWRDQIRQRWARDFYRAMSSANETSSTSTSI